jgi:DNA-binding MarR family transcriptional regulator
MMADQIVQSGRRFDSLEQEAYLSLWRTYDRLKAIEESFFQKWNLTPQQYNVLRILLGSESPLPTLAIATKLVSRAPDITRMLDKLEQEKWISRSRSSEDRRAVMVSITAEGRKRVSDMSDSLEEMHREQLGHLGGNDLRSLVELLAKVRQPFEPLGSSW